jgi:hypothetical protein
MSLGTRFGKVHGPNLDELFDQIRAFPFKIEHKQTLCKPNGEWYILFTIEDNVVLRAQNEPGINQAIEAMPENKNKQPKNRGIK